MVGMLIQGYENMLLVVVQSKSSGDVLVDNLKKSFAGALFYLAVLRDLSTTTVQCRDKLEDRGKNKEAMRWTRRFTPRKTAAVWLEMLKESIAGMNWALRSFSISWEFLSWPIVLLFLPRESWIQECWESTEPLRFFAWSWYGSNGKQKLCQWHAIFQPRKTISWN